MTNVQIERMVLVSSYGAVDRLTCIAGDDCVHGQEFSSSVACQRRH